MLINHIERERRQAYLDGFLEGVVKGILESMEKEKEAEKRSVGIEIARAMLASGEPLAKIKLYTSLTEDEILSPQKESVSN